MIIKGYAVQGEYKLKGKDFERPKLEFHLRPQAVAWVSKDPEKNLWWIFPLIGEIDIVVFEEPTELMAYIAEESAMLSFEKRHAAVEDGGLFKNIEEDE